MATFSSDYRSDRCRCDCFFTDGAALGPVKEPVTVESFAGVGYSTKIWGQGVKVVELPPSWWKESKMIKGKFRDEDIDVKLDTGCTPFNLVTSAMVEASKLELVPLRDAVVVRPFGKPVVLRSSVDLDIGVVSSRGEILQTRATYLVIPDTRRFALLGLPTLRAFGLVDLNAGIAAAAQEAAGTVLDATKLNLDVLGQAARTYPVMYKEGAEVSYVESMNKYGTYSHEPTEASGFGYDTPDEDDLVGKYTTQEMAVAFETMLADAAHEMRHMQGSVDISELLQLAHSFVDIFRLKLGAEPPCNLAEFDLAIKEGAKTPKFRMRNQGMSTEKADYMRNFNQMLVDLELANVALTSITTSRAFCVPKGDSYRQVIDYTPLNPYLEEYDWPMPTQQEQLLRLQGSKYFMLVDLDSCYYQFKNTARAKALLGYSAGDRVYQPNRMPMGIHNAVKHLQAQMNLLMEDEWKNILFWLDDGLIHAQTWEEFLRLVKFFFTKCREAGLYLNPKKCTLFAQEVTWCGRVINDKGVRFHPRQLKPLQEMASPQTAADLQQFICATNWFRSGIPEYAALVAPIQDFLRTQCVPVAGSNDKKRLASVTVSAVGWGPKEQAAFEAVKAAINNQMLLNHRDPAKVLCVFTDASSTSWSVCVTQVASLDSVPDRCLIHELDHEPLVMLSGNFSKSELKYPIVEKEAFAINQAVQDLGYLLNEPAGFHLFTDHRNLVYMLDPVSLSASVRQNTVEKMARWAYALFQCKFTLHHIPGEDNVWADLMTRWGRSSTFSTALDQATSPPGMGEAGLLEIVPAMERPEEEMGDAEALLGPGEEIRPETPADAFNPLRVEYVNWHNVHYSVTDMADDDLPSRRLVQAAQAKQPPSAQQVASKRLRKAPDGLWMKEDAFWLPSTDDTKSLRIRFCVVAHTGVAFHKQKDVTFNTLCKSVWWEGMKADFDKFYDSCLACVSNNRPLEIARPLGQTLEAKAPRDVLEMDFLYITKPLKEWNHRFQYILVLKDKYSKFVWLFPCVNADSQAVVEALLQWVAVFGVSHSLVSDQGSHFKNVVIEELNRRLYTRHHFTTAYSPWANGSVERVNSVVLAMVKKILSELRWDNELWVQTVPAMMFALNSTPLAGLDGLTPRQVMMGMDVQDPLASILHRPQGVVAANVLSLDLTAGTFQRKFEELQQTISAMHQQVDTRTDKKALKERALIASDKKEKVRKHRPKMANFEPGQFVLRARVVNNKLKSRWEGPYVVVRAENAYVYVIRDLLNEQKEYTVHCRRLCFYADKDLQVDFQLKDSIGFARGNVDFERFDKLRWNANTQQLELWVKWFGFDEIENTWEEIGSVYEDAPRMVKSFLTANKKHAQYRQACETLGIKPRDLVQAAAENAANDAALYVN